MSFKIGDKVIALKDIPNEGIKKGDKGILKRFNPGEKYPLTVCWNKTVTNISVNETEIKKAGLSISSSEIEFGG